MLMPAFTVTMSAGASRMVRATNWSRWDCPPKPRLVNDTPASRAATAGQVSAGSSASMQWLIELPWWIHRGRVSAGAGSTVAPSSTTRPRSST